MGRFAKKSTVKKIKKVVKFKKRITKRRKSKKLRLAQLNKMKAKGLCQEETNVYEEKAQAQFTERGGNNNQAGPSEAKPIEDNRMQKELSGEFASMRSSEEGAVYSRQSSIDEELRSDSVPVFDHGSAELANTGVNVFRRDESSDEELERHHSH